MATLPQNQEMATNKPPGFGLIKATMIAKSTVATVYIIGFIVLTAVGIWDVTNIVHDFMSRNRITTVTPISLTNQTYPFFGMLRVDIYSDGPLYSQKLNWSDFYSMLSDSWQGREVASNDNISYWEQRLRTAFPLVHMFGQIARMDSSGLEALTHQSLDNYILDPKKLKLMKKALADVQYFLGGIWFQTPTDVANFSHVHIDQSFPDVLKLTVADHIRPDHTDTAYGFGLIPEGMLDPPNISYSEITFPDGFSFQPNLEYILTHITVTNTAVINNRQFPPCSMEYETETECLEALGSRIVGEICQCQQLSRSEAFFHLDTREGDVRFCTRAIYEKCWKAASEAVERVKKEARAQKTCQPCVRWKNTYIVEQTRPAGPVPSAMLNVENGEYVFKGENNDIMDNTSVVLVRPQFYLIITCRETSYILLEDTPQFTLSQMISQVGGDLGLYIGVSMISLLEMVLFIYHMYQKRQQSSIETNAAASASASSYKDGVRFFMRFLLRSFNAQPEQDTESVQASRSMKNDMTTGVILKELQMMEDRLRKEMNERMDSLEQKIGSKRF